MCVGLTSKGNANSPQSSHFKNRTNHSTHRNKRPGTNSTSLSMSTNQKDSLDSNTMLSNSFDYNVGSAIPQIVFSFNLYLSKALESRLSFSTTP